jgi:serine/threonine-protein kinase
MSEVKERSIICGTPLFMSPEQICGAGLSAASDLFAVGGVAYELFCLQPPAPTEGSLHEVLQAILTYQPQPVDLMSHPIQGYVPSEFQPTIMTALHRDPMHRPQSAEEMMNTLQRALDGHIEIICPRSRIKYLLARFSRWLDYDPYKAVSRVYLFLYSSIILFILIGMGLGALLFSYFG